MSGNVVSITGGEIENERRQAFIQAVAATFDIFVERCGVEPDAIVYVMGGVGQQSLIAWDTKGDSLKAVNHVLSHAAIHMMTEASSGYRSLT